MNKQEFAQKYQDALLKTAIGVHIIETAGPRVGLDEQTMENNIASLCRILADGLGLDPMTVVEDVMEVRDKLPSLYIKHPEVEEYIRELEKAYEKQGMFTSKQLPDNS